MRAIYIFTALFSLSNLVFSQTNNCSYSGTPITVGSSCNYQTFNSTNSSDYWNSANSCGAADLDDAWWWFTATGTTTNISYYSGNDAVLHVFTGACASNMTHLACSDDFGSGGTESIVLSTNVGQNYAIRIQRYASNSSMNGTICVWSPPPCNDNNVNLNITAGSWPAEVSWSLVNPSGTTVASGGAPYNQNLCLPTGCYTFNMVDSYGDGWDGANYTFTLGGSSIGTGTLASGASGSALIGIGTSCTPPSPTSITASATSICAGAGTNVTLTANGASGTVHWFVGLCGTSGSFATGNSTVVSPTATTTYYARNFNGFAWSTNCASVTIVVNNPPTALSIGASPQTICAGQQTNLTSSANYSSTIHQAQNESDFLQFITNDPKWAYDFTANAGGTSPELFFDWAPSSTGLFWAQFGSLINATGYTNLNFQFKHFLDHFSTPYTLRLQTSPDGVTWTDRWTLNPTGNVGPATVNVPLTALNNSSFFYRFAFDGDSFDTDGWWIDDISITGTPPAISYAWSSTPAGFTSNSQNTSASPTINTDYTVTATANGCSNSVNVPVVVDAPSVAPTSITGGGSYCYGNQVTLTPVGGTLGTGATYQWFAGGCNTTVLGTGNTISVTPSVTTNYFVNVSSSGSGACPATSCANTTITLPSAGNSLSLANENATCIVNDNNFTHFYTSSGRLLVSINSNGQNLGNVTVTSYLEPAPLDVSACNNPSLNWITSTMARHWVITPQFQPSNPVIVRLPYDASPGGEYDQLFTAANSNLNDFDDIAGHNTLYLSKYSGPNVNNNASDNCSSSGGSGTTTIHTQTGNGLVSSYSPIPIANARYVEYSIPNFSEFWIHGSLINSPLPVKMGEIDAYCNEHTNINTIKWTTLTETNSNLFTIEKTTDFSNWNFVTEVNGAGNSSTQKNYQIQDEGNIEDTYYRIIQKDFNGEEEVFGPIKVSCKTNSNISIYPNPNNGVYSINIYSENGFEDGEFQIFDMNGKLLKSEIISVSSGLNSLNTNISDFAPGSYMLVVKNYEHIYKPIRIVKTR